MLPLENNGGCPSFEGVCSPVHVGCCGNRRCRVFLQLRRGCRHRLHVRPSTTTNSLHTTTLTPRFPDSYLVAVHDKRTGETLFRPAPLHILKREVKRLKSIQPTPVTAPQRVEARNALGSTFGTKKAQAAIRAHERNKIDIDAMKAVTGNLQSTIEGNTTNLPTQGWFWIPNSPVLTSSPSFRTSKGHRG